MGWVVYKHTSPNGKVYIGITGKNPLRRWRKDGSGYKYHYHFHRAILKYGWDNIKHEILYENLTENEASEMERKLIIEYKSDNPKYGYNKRSGGEHYYFSAEARKKMSNARIGKSMSEETKQKISNATKGRVQSAETRNKIGEALRKSVMCIETGKVYASLTEVQQITKIPVSNITKCCKGERKTAGGYHWEYVINNESTL